MQTVADMRGVGVKKREKNADVLCGRPLSSISMSKSDVVVFLIQTDENSIIQDLPKLLCINNIYFLNF